MSRFKAALILGLVLLANVALWAVPNRPLTVKAPWTRPIPSFSFAPYHRGESPLSKTFPTLPEIDQDLARVAAVAKSVRTYTSREGMEQVPPLARKYGLKVIQSAWLNSKAEDNGFEIAGLIRAANAYPDVINRVIVGNEVLLRKDLTPSQLIAYIRQVKHAVKQPVSYAEVWEYWLKNPQVAKDVDFLTIHILPYWEDDPVAIEKAVDHVRDIYQKLHAAFPGKPILIGETGWPSRGRSRNGAVPSRVNEARFMAGVLNLAQQDGFDINYVEAFDQPWKGLQEGTMGANWGYFDVDRRPKFSLSSRVVEHPLWPLACLASVLLAALAMARLRRLRPDCGPGGLIVFAVFSQCLASAVVFQVMTDFGDAYSLSGQLWAAARIALQSVMAAIILSEAARHLAGPAPLPSSSGPRLRTVHDSLAEIKRHWYLLLPWRPWHRAPSTLGLSGEATTLALTVTALSLSALLALDPRYRNFPIADFLVPALGLPALKAVVLARAWPRLQSRGTAILDALSFGHIFSCNPPPGEGRDPSPLPSLRKVHARLRDEIWLTAAIVLGAAAIAVQECLANVVTGPIHVVINREALAWAGIQLLLAVPYAANIALALTGTAPDRTAQTTPVLQEAE